MSLSLDRRSVLAGAAALGATGLVPALASAEASAGSSGWDALIAAARARAARPHADGEPAVAAVRAGDAVFLADEFRAPGDPGHFGAAAAIFAVVVASPLASKATGRGAPCAVDAASAPYLERPTFRHLRVEGDTLLGLLDGRSVCAAARLRLGEGGRALRIEASLFFRQRVEALVMAPCSALYRPHGPAAVLEADLLTGSAASGDLLRPLREPPRPTRSRFRVDRLRCFGLSLSADAAAAGARPPGLRVAPEQGFGEGDVVLFEAPAEGDVHDNIAAAFVPRRTFAAGDAFAYRYGLVWSVADPPRIS